MGPVVKEHCDQLELQLRRLRQLVIQKENTESMEIMEAVETKVPKMPRLLTRLESTPLLPSQQRKKAIEHLSFSPIDEPKSSVRNARERQSLRPGKANIVTNGTLNYCTPRMGRRAESATEV